MENKYKLCPVYASGKVVEQEINGMVFSLCPVDKEMCLYGKAEEIGGMEGDGDSRTRCKVNGILTDKEFSESELYQITKLENQKKLYELPNDNPIIFS